MNAQSMTWALAGRMAVTVILVVIAYALLVIAVARLMAWVGSKYPRLHATHEEYYGEDDPPRAA